MTREPAPFEKNIPAELHRILRKALQKKRDERYQTVKDLLLDLKTLKHELEVETRSDTDEIMHNNPVSPEDATSEHLEIPTIENRSGFNSIPIIMPRSWRSNRVLMAVCAVLAALAGTALFGKSSQKSISSFIELAGFVAYKVVD